MENGNENENGDNVADSLNFVLFFKFKYHITPFAAMCAPPLLPRTLWLASVLENITPLPFIEEKETATLHKRSLMTPDDNQTRT